MKRHLRIGPLIFRDPVFLCAGLYVLLWFDTSGFLRLGLCAAFLHECGHILVYMLLLHEAPVIEVTWSGFCMQTRGRPLTAGQTFLLATAGPAVNLLLAALWTLKMERAATVRGSAFLAANVLTGAFNLLPIPPLDGAQMVSAVLDGIRQKNNDCNSPQNRVQ